METKRPVVAFIDIETSPSLGYVWGRYQQDVIATERDWYIMSFCVKWMGGKTETYALPDFEIYSVDTENDIELVAKLYEVYNKADIVIAHNGDRFDIRKSYARFIYHGLVPPSPFKTIDTLKVARKFFKFDSNRLNDLGIYLGVGKKVRTGGFDLWSDCMKGDLNAWSRMKKYNKGDVLLLEKIYMKLRPYIANHVNLTVFTEESGCPACMSKKVIKRGFSVTNTGKMQRYQCQDCGKWSHSSSKRVDSLIR